MGYLYRENQLCCDVCGKTGNVKKHKCPFGWCQQPLALCPECKKIGLHTKKHEYHKNCEKLSNDFDLREKETLLKRELGFFVRCSALRVDNGRVHVIFRGKDGKEKGKYMKKETYHSIPLLEIATIEDYEKIEANLESAPTNFY